MLDVISDIQRADADNNWLIDWWCFDYIDSRISNVWLLLLHYTGYSNKSEVAVEEIFSTVGTRCVNTKKIGRECRDVF